MSIIAIRMRPCVRTYWQRGRPDPPEKPQAKPQHRQTQGIAEKADVFENPGFNEHSRKQPNHTWNHSRKSRLQKNRGRRQNTDRQPHGIADAADVFETPGASEHAGNASQE